MSGKRVRSGLDTSVEQLRNQKPDGVDQNWSKTNISVAMLGCEIKEGISAVPKTGESALKPGREEEFMEAGRDRNRTIRHYYWRQYCGSIRKVAKTGQVCVCGWGGGQRDTAVTQRAGRAAGKYLC